MTVTLKDWVLDMLNEVKPWDHAWVTPYTVPETDADAEEETDTEEETDATASLLDAAKAGAR